MSFSMHVSVALACLAVGALLGLIVLASRQSRLKKVFEGRIAGRERELAAARRLAAQSEADRQVLARVVRELPHVAHELHAVRGGRQIPKLLLDAVVRLFEPTKAIVAIRRRPAESDPDRHMKLVVAATSPEGYIVIGTEIPIGHGEIGYAAEVQRVMDRRDFESQPAPTRTRLRRETNEGCLPDIVAPMVFDEEVFGVIAIEGARRLSEAKDALRLLGQVGAVSAHTQAKYTEMKTTANIDSLTGVFNKRYLTHRLAEELRRAHDEIRSVSVFIFDLDNFKHYNDRNGHVAGDHLLQRLAKLVLEIVRQDTVFGRYGGEEFLVIFPGAKRAQALAAAENVRSAVAAHEFPFGFDQPLGIISISGGVAECPVDGADATTLVRAADEALYQAKHSGRNRVMAYEPTYLGGEDAQLPVEGIEGARERAALQASPALGSAGQAVTLDALDTTPPRGTHVATD
jgi:diguanylate cyclase (GGDEF)-like protein